MMIEDFAVERVIEMVQEEKMTIADAIELLKKWFKLEWEWCHLDPQKITLDELKTYVQKEIQGRVFTLQGVKNR